MIVQIYEIQDPEEAKKCIELGVDHVGSVILSREEWKQPEIRQVTEICRAGNAKSSIIPLFREADLTGRVIEYYRPDIIHFCDSLVDGAGKSENLDEYIKLQEEIREKFPEVKIMRSIPIPVNNSNSGFPWLKIARQMEPVTDFFLTDTWLGKEPVEGFIGITGIRCSPDMARSLVEQSKIPVILAGGLSPENVYESIEETSAHGADSCTRTNILDKEGKAERFKKDFQKVKTFVEEVRRAEKMTREKIEKIREELENLKELLKDREAALPAHSIRPHQLILIEELEEKIAKKEEELRKLQGGEGI